MNVATPVNSQSYKSAAASVFIPLAFVLVLTGEYLADVGFPHLFTYAPELCGVFASMLLVMLVVRNGLAPIPASIWIVLFLISLHLVFGILANHVQVGTAMIGGRIYLRTMPFFLLPLAAIPSSRELIVQFRVLIILGLLQLPIAIHQRLSTMNRTDLTTVKYLTSGDLTYGTLMNSAILSLFLICLASVVFVVFLRKRMNGLVTLALLAALLFPTTINETKATAFILPMVILILVLFAPRRKKGKSLLLAAGTIAAFLVIFIPISDYLVMPRWGYGFVDFLTMPGRVEGYLMKNAEVGTTGPVGRIDAIVLPLTEFKNDPVKMTLGLGMGSLTESSFGVQYAGEYAAQFGALMGPTVSRLLWETGCLGLLLVTVLLYLIFDAARRLRHSELPIGFLSHAWVGIVPVMFVGMFYKDIMNHPTLGILFWYYSGVVVVYASISQTRRPGILLGKNS